VSKRDKGKIVFLNLIAAAIGLALAQNVPVEGMHYVPLATEVSRAKLFSGIEDFHGPGTGKLVNGIYQLETVDASVPPDGGSGGMSAVAYFEHIFNGSVRDVYRSRYTPDSDAKELKRIDENSGALIWPNEMDPMCWTGDLVS